MDNVALANLEKTQLALRAALAAAIAAAIAQALKLDFPIFALLSAVIATDLTPLQSRRLGLWRLVATVIGALFGALASLLLPPTAWSVGLGILCTMLVSQRVRARGGAKVASYICAIIILHYGEASWNYAYYRLIETALGVIVAWFVALVPLLIPNELVETRRGAERVHGWMRTGTEPEVAEPFVADLQLAIRVAVAATLAILISARLGLGFPIFAAIAAVITTDLSPATSRALGLSRIAATLVGAACGGLMGAMLPADPWWSGAGILIAMIACQVAGLSEAAKVAACTCGIVMAMHAGEPTLFAFQRVVETSIGVMVAWAVSFVPKLMKLDETESTGNV
jgi:uncharacterized membrane protein YgaE (UPF0421/DUF939 family)